MKKFLIIQAAILVCAVVFGVAGKASFYDTGISGIQSLEVAYNFSTPVYVKAIFTDENQTLFDSVDETLNQKGQSSYVLVVHSTGKVNQEFFTLSQRVEVEKVIKGDQSMSGTTIDIYSLGFAYVPDMASGPTFYGECNLMKPGDEYLVFLDDMSINKYMDVPSYRFGDGNFGCLNLTRDSEEYLDATTPIQFGELKSMEYFADSQKVLQQINLIKHKIIEKYDS